jgi:hypothetical protein
MLDPISPAPPAKTVLGVAGTVLRFIAGYIIAVAVGAVLFSIITYLLGAGRAPDAPPVEIAEALDRMWGGFVMFFVLGLLFGLPYTIIGSLLFKFVLPRNAMSFMITGTLCPVVAIFTMGAFLGGTFWWGPEMLAMFFQTLPSGLAATYLFGAIGFGLGFRHWRFG